MLSTIENICIAFLIAALVSFVAYFIVLKIKAHETPIVQLVATAILFLFLFYQSYSLSTAWDEKSAIEETMEGINDWTTDAIDFIDEIGQQSGASESTSSQILEAAKNPLLQKGLKLFGIELNSNGGMTVEMAEKLKEKYNWFMFRRLLWMLGGITIYMLVSCTISSRTSSTKRKTGKSYRKSNFDDF